MAFTRAAAELGVTQSAVSHQIRKLEDYFGVALLQRQKPGIEITPAGAQLRQELAAALDALGALDAQVRRRLNRTTLRVGAAGSLTLGDMGLCMSAAAEGTGVTLGRSLLVADAISSGRLMSTLADYPTVECTKIQVAQWPADLIGDRSVELFVNWLAEQ